ncbi:Purine nucleoside phosphorylase I inosine and guanosine-specific, partial [Fasciolopsis buskii]
KFSPREQCKQSCSIDKILILPSSFRGSRTTASFESIDKIVKSIRERISLMPTIGVICGSGLGKLADAVQQSIKIPYQEIPGFPQSTVPGHKGNLVFGTIGPKNVMVMQGRFHSYEGYSNEEISIPIRVMKLLGVNTILISNAAGGLNKKLKVGDFLIIKDHISMPGLALHCVLVGPNDDRFGPRFPATSDAYDKQLRSLMLKIANEKGMKDVVHEGVYCFCGGPSYETPAESRMLAMLGADVTGMSTVPEVIVARHCGIRVLAVSLVTNLVLMDVDETSGSKANHEEVLETANKRANTLQDLFTDLITRM